MEAACADGAPQAASNPLKDDPWVAPQSGAVGTTHGKHSKFQLL